jgi:hypothetical protein
VPITKPLDYWTDLRAGLHDLCGIPFCTCGQGDKHLLLTDDQQKAIDAVQQHSEVGLCGGTGTGKSYILGCMGLVFTAVTLDSKALYGGPKMDQTLGLSWLELLRAHRAFTMWCERRNISPGRSPGVGEWYPLGKDARPEWNAKVMALSANDEAAAVRGMMHAPGGVLALLEEVHGIAPLVMDAIDDGLNQTNAHLWFSFNPVNDANPAGQRWARLTPGAQVTFNALDAAEWQARHGAVIPGMPSRQTIAAKWAGRETDPRYYVNVLGQFPPKSADRLVIPQDWYDLLSDPANYPLDIEPTPTHRAQASLGVDTAGGRAENIIASFCGIRVKVEWAERELHQTPRLVAEVRRVAEQFAGQRMPIAVDLVGQGGKGVHDDLVSLGYNAIPMQGAGSHFAGRRESDYSRDKMELCDDAITWAWFAVRDLARLTVDAIRAGRPERYIRFPVDAEAREQWARPFALNGSGRYEMAGKDKDKPALGLTKLKVSPDRADAAAMAVLARIVQPAPSRVLVDLTESLDNDPAEGATVGGWLNG